MGYVWNVILSFSDEEFWHEGEDEARTTCAALVALNKLMSPDGKLVDLTKATFKSSYGMSAHVYGGGFKHFDVNGFIADVQAQAWKDPLNVQLFLKSDSDERFSLHPLFKPKRNRKPPSKTRTA